MKLLAAVSLSLATAISAGCAAIAPQQNHSSGQGADSVQVADKPTTPKKFAHKNYR